MFIIVRMPSLVMSTEYPNENGESPHTQSTYITEPANVGTKIRDALNRPRPIHGLGQALRPPVSQGLSQSKIVMGVRYPHSGSGFVYLNGNRYSNNERGRTFIVAALEYISK